MIKAQVQECEIHWVTRSDFSEMLDYNPNLKKVWSLSQNSGLMGLLRLAMALRRERFTHIYDAHNNIRSTLLTLLLRGFWSFLPFGGPKLVRRSKERWARFLLFKLRINKFPKPYKAQFSYIDPLNEWEIRSLLPRPPQVFFSPEVTKKVEALVAGLPPFICIVPSAAWNMKRWPKAHWISLINIMPKEFFVILGGKNDQFCHQFREIDPGRVVSFVGQLTHLESSALLTYAKIVVVADTGLLHIADQLGVPTIALMGPTAFGFPTRTTTCTLEQDLPCRPCTKDGRGKCSQTPYKKCMIDIKPQRVAELIMSMTARTT